MTPTVRGICTFAVFFSVSRPFRSFTLAFALLASHSSCSLSPLGDAMCLSQLSIGSFYLFKMLFSVCSLSLLLAILALLAVSASDVLDLVEYA